MKTFIHPTHCFIITTFFSGNSIGRGEDEFNFFFKSNYCNLIGILKW